MSKNTISFGYALAFASVVNGLLVVAKELIPAVMTGMQRLTGHHWITHSLIVLMLFAGLGWMFGRANGGAGIRATAGQLVGIVVCGAGVGSAIIFGFYLLGD